ncbi:hypothetical protein Dimus_032025, partial [Dionaea muscipula]
AWWSAVSLDGGEELRRRLLLCGGGLVAVASRRGGQCGGYESEQIWWSPASASADLGLVDLGVGEGGATWSWLLLLAAASCRSDGRCAAVGLVAGRRWDLLGGSSSPDVQLQDDSGDGAPLLPRLQVGAGVVEV